MSASNTAYAVYLLMLFLDGLILSTLDLTLRSWQLWGIVITTVIVYVCGVTRGGI